MKPKKEDEWKEKRGSAWKKNIWLWSGIAKTKKVKIKLGFREKQKLLNEKKAKKKVFSCY